jgi:hypothetical protein
LTDWLQLMLDTSLVALALVAVRLVLLVRFEAGQLLAVTSGDDLDEPALVEDAELALGHVDGHHLAGMREPDLDPLASDLELAALGCSSVDHDRPWGTTRAPRASLAPCSLAREPTGTGEGSDRTSAPSASTCMVAASRRRVTVCPASGSPTETCLPATPTVPAAFTRRSTSTASPGPTSTAWAAVEAGAGLAGLAPCSRPWPSSSGRRRTAGS